MTNSLKKNTITIVIVIATLVLAGIAIFTAIKLYQSRQTSVAPNAPVSHPAAATICDTGLFCQVDSLQGGSACTSPNNNAQVFCCPTGQHIENGVCAVSTCNTSFSISIATSTPTASPTPTPTPTPVPQCGTTCSTTSDCTSGMTCYIASGTTGVCRNPSCTTNSDCVCQTATPTPTTTATATPFIATNSPTPAPQLPTSGTIEPTILGISAGAILLVISLALVL